MLIGLSGYARTGKDTVADILVKEHGFTKIGFSDPLYEMALRLDPLIETSFWLSDDGHLPLSKVVAQHGWETAKDEYPEVRRILQALGTDAGREVLGENVWVDALLRRVEPEGRYVIRDMRFPNEFYAVENEGGATVRIERPGYGPTNGHISETALDDFLFGFTLCNDGTINKLEHYCSALVAHLEHLS
jgi:hypothetical protein